MADWLFKSEPTTWSIDDLAAVGRDWWDGVRNYQARNFMMNDMQPRDRVLFYHSSCPVPAVVGEAAVSASARPDPSQFEADDDYHDPKATPDKPRWWCVEIAFVSRFPKPVTLAMIRQKPALKEMGILRRGNRLSITPVTRQEYELIVRLGNQERPC